MIVLLLMLACGDATVASAPPEASAEIQLTRLDLHTADDFPSVQRAFSELLHGGGGHLEVVLAPGDYRGGAISCSDPAHTGRVAVSITGGPGVVLHGTDVHIDGSVVEIDGLAFTSVKLNGVALKVGATESVSVSHVAFVDVVTGVRAHAGSGLVSALVGLEARGPDVHATLSDAWVVGVTHRGGQPPIRIVESGGHFASVDVSGLAMAGPASSLLLSSTGPVVVRDSVVVAHDGTPPFVSGRPRMSVTVEGGHYLLDHDDAWLRALESADAHGPEFLPVEVHGAVVAVRSDAPADHDPPALLHDVVHAEASEPDLDAWRKAAHALGTPDPAALLP